MRPPYNAHQDEHQFSQKTSHRHANVARKKICNMLRHHKSVHHHQARQLKHRQDVSVNNGCDASPTANRQTFKKECLMYWRAMKPIFKARLSFRPCCQGQGGHQPLSLTMQWKFQQLFTFFCQRVFQIKKKASPKIVQASTGSFIRLRLDASSPN